MVTGGAGFIGSFLCRKLLERENKVTAFDNLSAGHEEWLPQQSEEFKLVKGDLLDKKTLSEEMKGVDTVFHYAANPDVRAAMSDTRVHFDQNILATFNVLEAMRESETARELVFASSSVVYGVPEKIPTPESYGPLLPISMYGSSKLAAEAMIASYSDNYGISATMMRYANIIGGRAHGVTFDFVNKLKKSPGELEILGDGTQTKSYLLLDDCVEGTLFAAEKTKKLEVFNLGSEDQLNVKKIADIIVEAMKLESVGYNFTGGKAWMGDVKIMLLDIGKIKALGWSPKHGSEEAVRTAVERMLKGEP